MARGRKEFPRSYKKEGCSGLGLPEAPVFYPTDEEFKDPLEYIAQIRHLAEPYGLCRIVPPKFWDPPFALDLQSFSFPTKLQAIHQLQERSAALNPDTFRFEYDRYLESQGRVLESWPQFCGEELDLCKVYNCVRRYGGYEKVMEQKKWGEVLRMVKPDVNPASFSTAAPANLSHLYEKHLLEYELHRAEGLSKQASSSQTVESDAGAKISVQESEDVKHGRKRSLEEEAANVVAEPPKRTKSEDETTMQARTGDQACEQCRTGAHEQLMINCDLCDRAWHLYCLSPPLSEVPPGRWYCLDCVASEQDTFGFAQGNRHTLDSFRRMCERFKKKWFGGRPVTYSDVEEQFWEIVERSTGPVEVLYGSDLDTSVYGSGFPRASDAIPKWAKPETWEAHAKSPWNLNNFPKLNGSMLRLVNENIPGVIVPWLYVGMLFSSFCWHYEDHCFYSVNYLHWGEPKCWYSVPGSAYDAFEEVMRSTFPDLFHAQPDLLFQLVTMLNPAVLREKGVPVCTTLQEAGHFVITFPRSYHGGFNHGFNCAEAVNFAPLDWIPFGRFSVERYRFYHKAAVISHEELLCVVAKNDTSGKPSSWMCDELMSITLAERKLREELWQRGMVKSSRMLPRAYTIVGKEEDAECIICRYYLHLSAVVCSCRPGSAVCLEHAEQLCECSAEKKCLLYRLSLAELEDIQQAVSDVKQEVKLSDVLLQKEVKGKMVSLMELASSWVTRASSTNTRTPSLNEVEDLLRQAEQFLWAGHEMDDVRRLESALASKYNWAKEVAACYNAVQERLHGSKSSRLLLSRVSELVAVTPLPCIEPYVSKLKPFVRDACQLQKQIGSRLGAASPEVRALQRLQHEVLRLPFDFPEAQKMQEILTAAQMWSERVQRLLSTGKESQKRELADLNQLLELQAEAVRLAVVVPEKRLLDVIIKKVESWQQHASELFDCIPPAQEIEEVLCEAAGLPVRLSQADLLKKYLEDARSWSERAQTALKTLPDQKSYADTVVTLKDLVEASEGLRAQVDELSTVKIELKRFSWMEKASNALGSRSPTNVLVELLKEATGNEDLLPEVRYTAETAAAWEEKAREALRTGSSYSIFQGLLRDSETLNVALAHLADIKHAVEKADSWLPRASVLAEACRNGSKGTVNLLELNTLKDLVYEMEGSPILLPELDILRTCLQEVEEWSSQAADVQASVRGLLTGREGLCDLESDGVISLLIVELQTQLSRLQLIANRGVPYNFGLPQFEDIQRLIRASAWTLKALELLSNASSLQALELQLEAGRTTALVTEECFVFKFFEAAKNRAKTWHSKVTALIEDFETKVSSCLLEQLLKEAEAIKVDFRSEVSQLKQILADHRAWQLEVQKVFNGSSTLSLSELLYLQESGEASLVQSIEVDSLETVIVGVGAWLVRCEEVVGTAQNSLRDGLLQLKRSADQALEVALHRGGETKAACVCLELADSSDDSTLTCDKCRDRFHAPCVGVTQFQTRTQNQKQYVCPFCTAISSGAVFPKDDVTSKIHATQKPTLSSLVGLANAAKSLHCRVEEEDLIESILDSVFTWQEWVQATVSPMLANDGENVDLQVLQSALKAACMLQVQDDASGEVKRAIAVRAWRIRTRRLLESIGKPCFRSICRALEEALSMGVPSEDELLREIRKRESEASGWAERAKQVVEDEGLTPLEEVNFLIARGEGLPVTVTKELTALRARSVLYCVCRKPYDEARAMIGCDRCGEWYHFTCINLPEPESNDGDCEEFLRDELGPGGEFFCPACKKVGKTKEHIRLLEDAERSRNEALGKVTSNRRGKRSSRTRQRPRHSDYRLEYRDDSADYEVDEEEEDEDDDEELFDAPSKARPCRRTAGQHSGFDSFVVLSMRSR